MRRAMVLTVVLLASLWARFAQAGEENKDVARAYFQAGVALYDQGKYEQALYEFQRAQALSHNAELYFNMAACEEHMDHFQAAAVFLKQYLLEKPFAADSDNVKARIKALEARDDRVHRPDGEVVNPPPTTQPPPQPAPPPKPPRKPIGGFIALGVTAAFGIGAIGSGSYTVVDHSDLKSGCGSTVSGCSSGDRDGLKSAALATDVLIGFTAAAAVATVVLFVLEHRHPAASKQAARAELTF